MGAKQEQARHTMYFDSSSEGPESSKSFGARAASEERAGQKN